MTSTVVVTRGDRSPDRRDPSSPVFVGPLLPLWIALPTAGVAALVMDLAYPAVGFWPAAFVATALLLIAMIGRTIPAALGVGLVFGLMFFGLLVSWTSRYLGPLPWGALTVVEGVLTGIGVIPLALAYRWLPRIAPGSWGRLLLLPGVVAALWAGREVFLGTWPYDGLPWARLGMTQAESPTAELASWMGVSGLSFLMAFTVAAIIEWLRLRGWQRNRVLAVIPLTAMGVLVLMPAYPTTPAGTMRIGGVQGNGPSGYFDRRGPWDIVGAQGDATVPLYDENVDLVVWPEGLDGDPFQDPRLASYLSQVSSQAGAPLLANAATEADGDTYNTSFLWEPSIGATPAREDLQTHAKRHPVPFGEYVPDRAFYNALAPELVGLIQREYTQGTDVPMVTVGDIRVGLAICFDVIYDEVIAESVSAGAEVLVFQTNNADFRDTDENLQQLGFARMRAIETGRSVVNISTVGTSQIIHPDGSTAVSLPAGETGVLTADVELRTGTTLGVQIGSAVSSVLLWSGLATLVLAGLLAKRAGIRPGLPGTTS